MSNQQLRGKTVLLLVSTAVALLVLVTTYLLLRHNGLLNFHPSMEKQSSRSRWFRLPFSLPCAVESTDADKFYSALKHSDKTTVVAMLAAHRMLMIAKNTTISILPLQEVAAVSTHGTNDANESVCFVPSSIVATIESKANRN